MTLPRPLPVYDVNSDRYPDDDKYIEQWKTTMLNRIDQEWECDQQISWSRISGPEYCGLPEHDPFTNRCWDHTPAHTHRGTVTRRSSEGAFSARETPMNRQWIPDRPLYECRRCHREVFLTKDGYLPIHRHKGKRVRCDASETRPTVRK